MSTGRRKFTAEYRAEAAHRVVDSGRSIAELAREREAAERALRLAESVNDDKGSGSPR